MLTRRTALLSVVGVTAVGPVLTACDLDSLRPPDAEATVTPSASAGEPSADETLVAEAAGAIEATMVVVAAARGIAPLRRRLGPVLRDHRRHLALLDRSDDGPDDSQQSSTVASTPADPASALTSVRDQEQALREQLAGFAVRAESGTLAALLASMSGSVGQHLADLGSTS